ncbi:MAG: class IV adenylate cyclase [Patescibacteria group bacterium]|nr:class IV adenylate cyclase [Patescibacteria group bacterium]
MREVEIKAQVKDLRAAEGKLLELGGKISSSVVQADRIFLQNGVKMEQVTVNTPVLRIRKQDPGKILLTYKHILGEELDKQEHEVEISDADEMEKILKFSGYYEIVRFTKRRRKCKIDGYTICLDEVEGLGDFIEIEKLFPDGDGSTALTTGSEISGQAAQAELFSFLKKLGAEEADKVLQGYDVLIYNKKNPKS